MLSRIGFTCLAPFLELAFYVSQLVLAWFHRPHILFRIGLCLSSCLVLALSASHIVPDWISLPLVWVLFDFFSLITGFRLALSTSQLALNWLSPASHLFSKWLFLPQNLTGVEIMCLTTCHEFHLSASKSVSGLLNVSLKRSQSLRFTTAKY
jgi:hypothetical protein